MLWEIRALMRPAYSVIDLIPNVHRTPALATMRRSVLEGKPYSIRFTAEERELAFLDAQVQLTSPIGARVLKTLYYNGTLKLKKPPQKSLPALDAYIATEERFNAQVTAIIAAEDSRRARLKEIIADPSLAQAEELTPWLIDKVFTARLGPMATGTLQIAGFACHRDWQTGESADPRLRPEPELVSWWIDGLGQRRGA